MFQSERELLFYLWVAQQQQLNISAAPVVDVK